MLLKIAYLDSWYHSQSRLTLEYEEATTIHMIAILARKPPFVA